MRLSVLPYIILLVIFFCVIFSCKKKEITIIETSYDPEKIPSMYAHNDTTYIWDSGRVKYKVIAETVLVYDKASEPYTLFPDKGYLEQYDSIKTIITTLRADSIWNYSRQKLWKLRGNVNIVNIEGKTFDSEELFWDETRGKIYSDLYVVINEPNKTTIRAYGFESNQEMTEYTFRRTTDVDIYVDEQNDL